MHDVFVSHPHADKPTAKRGRRAIGRASHSLCLPLGLSGLIAVKVSDSTHPEIIGSNPLHVADEGPFVFEFTW